MQPVTSDEPTTNRGWYLLGLGIALIAGGIPLLAYPAVLVAGVMSLAGHRTGAEPILQVLVSYACILGSLAYPLAYLPCAIFAFIQIGLKKYKLAFMASLCPLAYLCAWVLLVMLWMQIS